MDAQIKSSTGKEARAAVEFRQLAPSERRKRALQGLAICWGLAVLTAPLPPIHWVTVPFFFFFGFYWAAKKYRETVYLKPLSFPCPECAGAVTMPEQPWRERMEAICPHCRFRLRVEPPAAP